MVDKTISELEDAGLLRPGDITILVRDGVTKKSTVPGAPQTLTDGATISWNAALGTSAEVTLGGSRAMAFPTNLVARLTYTLTITQDATGSRTLTWDPLYRFTSHTAPTLTTAAGYSDIIQFYHDGIYMIEIGRRQGFKLFEDPPPPDSLIVSLHRVEIPITGSNKSATYDLPAPVVQANCIWFPGGSYSEATSSAADAQAYGYLSDTDTITAQRSPDGSPVENVTVRGTLVEFADGFIEQQQFKTFSASSGNSVNTALTAVYDLDRSFVVFHGINTTVGNGDHGQQLAVSMTGTQQVTCYRPGAGSGATVAITAYQLAAEYVTQVVHVNEVINTSTTGANIAVSSTDPDNTLLIWGGTTQGNGFNWSDASTSLTQNSATNLQAGRQGTASGDRRMCCALVELADGIIEAMERNTTLLNNVATGTPAITSSDEDLTVILYGGIKSYTGSTNGLHLLAAVKQTSDTALQIQKGTSGTQVELTWQKARFAE
jgi:hypothetical protein